MNSTPDGVGSRDPRATKIAALIASLTDDKDVATNLCLEVWNACSPEQKKVVADAFAAQLLVAITADNYRARDASARIFESLASKLMAERGAELEAAARPRVEEALRNAVDETIVCVRKRAVEILDKALSDVKYR